MPVKKESSDDKQNEAIERAANYECHTGFTLSQNMYEEIDGENELIGYFGLCLRRLLPAMPEAVNLNALEKRKYKTSQCDICQYEWAGKWPIKMKTKRVIVNNIEHKERITKLAKPQILAAIKQFIDNGCRGTMLIKRGDKLPQAPAQSETNDIDEVPF